VAQSSLAPGIVIRGSDRGRLELVDPPEPLTFTGQQVLLELTNVRLAELG
jgi:hypothetical protein